MGEKMEKSHC